MAAGKIAEFPLDEEYKKNTGITREDIAKLRAWLSSQPHLPGEHITDLDLILAFHSCKRSAEVTKQVLDVHFTAKTLFHNFFKNRIVDNKELRSADIVLAHCLEGRTPEGNAVLYARLIDYDVKNFVFCDLVRNVLMVLDLWQRQDGTWPGFVIVLDLDRVTLGHIARLDVQTVQQLFYYLQEALLVQLKSLHFISAPSFMDRLMMIIRPFIKKELMEMLHIHQVGSTTIDQHVPMEMLSKDAGGKAMGFKEAKELTVARLKANADFFEAENKKRVVESKRPGKPKTISDIFGSVEGSFKKLDID